MVEQLTKMQKACLFNRAEAQIFFFFNSDVNIFRREKMTLIQCKAINRNRLAINFLFLIQSSACVFFVFSM